MFDFHIGNEWDQVLAEEFQKEYFLKLTGFLNQEYSEQEIYPPAEDVFNGLKCSDFSKTKVVILGQDPYHEPGQAHGMCFSVKKGVKIPPSLVNIYKEMDADLGIKPVSHGYLEEWANQGVLLLNTSLTVRRGQAGSHRNKGWEVFTDRIIQALNERPEPIVFLLWGANAKAKVPLITGPQHFILTGAHPSPLSAWNGFFGGRYFSKTNRFLELTGQTPINWQLSE